MTRILLHTKNYSYENVQQEMISFFFLAPRVSVLKFS